MSNFKRSPSKMCWTSESLEWREVSESPGSQDSGFSDTEISPKFRTKQSNVIKIPKNIFKESPTGQPSNLSSNYQEKTTPDKDIKSKINAGSPRTYTKNSPKVSRNLFNVRDKKAVKDVLSHQYSKDVTKDTTHLSTSSSEITCRHSLSRVTNENHGIFRSLHIGTRSTKEQLNTSAPAALYDIRGEEEISFNGNHSLSSDCESELECLFEAPKHTSTPKAEGPKMRHNRNKVPLNLFLKYQQDRLPRQKEPHKNEALDKWMMEIQYHYDQECMTTLQSKSIAGELNQNVAHQANHMTINIRNILSHSGCIEMEYKNLNGDTQHVGPLVQSLAGNIIDFLKTYTGEIKPSISKEYDAIRKTSNSEDLLKLVPHFFDQWQSSCHDILCTDIKKLVEKIENPRSELTLRATITAITSLSLRNASLIDIFLEHDLVPILLILCEKCEGSSVRSLLFRALSTICCSASAVRQFEKYSGVQIVTETLEESVRPEPERSEAVALLAQVTAPWIEDNHSIKNLQDYSRKLVKSLTKFATATKCCQNLLLCAAALANLSAMDHKCIKYMLHLNTLQLVLEAVNKRGPCVSVYLLEQVATLTANMTSLEATRQQLTRERTVAALLCFLKTNSVDQEVGKRLQQKSIIALSRLCSEGEAARQVVELGGVDKLVKLCRDKDERFSSDAVLVATLATLRKITDTCGRDIISSEDAQELVEPKLLDSFLAYSTQSESYV